MLTAGLALSLQSMTTAQDLHPKLKKKEITIRKIMIMPARIELVKQGMKGGEEMIGESEVVSAAIHQLITNILLNRKFEIVESPFTPEAMREDEKLGYSLNDVQSRFDNLSVNLFKKSKDVKKGRFTMGDEIADFNPDGAADAIVFIRGTGTILTGGKKVFGHLAFGPKDSSAQLRISLVDARLGDVLYSANIRVLGDIASRPEKKLTKPLTKSLKKLPAADK